MTGEPARTKTRPARHAARRLYAVVAAVLGPRTVVGGFLRNGDVMGMALLYRGRADEDEARAGAQLLDVACPTVAHAGPQPAHELVDERRQRSLVGHASFDTLRHQLAAAGGGCFPAADPLAVAVAGAGHHRPERPHAAVDLEAAPLVEDRLPRALRQAREQAADHDARRPGRDSLGGIARVADATVGDERHSVLRSPKRTLVHRGDLRHADAGDDPRSADR